nr:hypothetical protein [Tanacetum cinerariifolium]
WIVINDSDLDDLDVFRSVVDHLAPPLLFSQLLSMNYEQLLTEFNVGAARQTCLSIEDGRLKERDAKIASFKAQLYLREAEAAEAIYLRVHAKELRKEQRRGQVINHTTKNIKTIKKVYEESSASAGWEGLAVSGLASPIEKFHILDVVRPKLPGGNDRTRNSLVKMNLFAFINHADPTNVWIREREVAEGEVPLLQLTRGPVVSLASVNDQGNVNVQGVGNDDVNEEGGDVIEADQTKHSDRVKVRKKRKAADGAGGFGLLPKKLREDYGASGDAGVITARKSLATLQGLLDSTTLAVEVGATVAATVPFVTSSVTPTPEHEDSGPTDSISVSNLRTQCPPERFLIFSNTPHDFSTNATDDDFFFIVKSFVLDPPVLTTVVATTVVVNISSLVPRAGYTPIHHTLFTDSTSMGEANPDTASPSQPADA